MDRFNRIYRINRLLSNRRTPIPLKQIMEHLECSKATADRDLQALRDHLNAPVEYNRQANGYYYNQQTSSTPYELPGLWFSTEELHGLLICQQILQNISPGILSEQIDSMQQRINKMLSRENSPQPVIADKIAVETIGRRLKDDSHFKRIASALFSNKQLQIKYHARGPDSKNKQRIISPQKLIFYRQNWYIAAFCHCRVALRIFAIDRVNSAQILDKSAYVVSKQQLQKFINSSYGIFTGAAEHTAQLEFSKERAKWVADEYWHPEQKGLWLENGNYQLSIPYSDSRELIMDILKHGAEVKVIEPPRLVAQIKEQIEKMKKIYCSLKY